MGPLAEALGVAVEPSDDLLTGAGLRALDLARAAGAGAVLCTHGDVAFDVVAALRRQGVAVRSAPGEKASTWVFELEGDRVVAASYLPPPA